MLYAKQLREPGLDDPERWRCQRCKTTHEFRPDEIHGALTAAARDRRREVTLGETVPLPMSRAW
jgi:hypothetical protein